MSKIFNTEAELATHVIEWLGKQGWTVHQEVMITGSGRTADIVAEKDNKIWIVECKNSFTESVLEQCYMHGRYCHYVSAAVPGSKKRNYYSSSIKMSIVKKHFIKSHGIGLIVVDKGYKNEGIVRESIKPKYQRMFNNYPTRKQFINNIKNVKNKFHLLHQNATAGGAGAQVTDYNITMYKVREYISKNGPTDPLTIAKNIKHHYSNNSGCKQGIMRGIDNNWIPGLEKKIESKNAVIFLKEGYELDGTRSGS